MSRLQSWAVECVERGIVPDRLVRVGIRELLRARVAELGDADIAGTAARTQDFAVRMRAAPIAPLPEKANQQHYELPSGFFGSVLGNHRKYSCGLWTDRTSNLTESEEAALAVTCERAELADGQNVLELGCGWGSLSLWMAEHYRGSRITALSNSSAQREYIVEQARQRGLTNLRVITHDINEFDTTERFDRVVSVEMFEHLRNWPAAFAKVSGWLAPQGRFLLHVFVHRGAPYEFVERDQSDWMSRHFFSGGMMPSDDLALHCQDDLRLLRRWRWDGTHYQRTSEAWLRNMESRRETLMPLLAQAYGEDAALWWTRWRLFFLSVAELFGFENGRRWWVSHYLFAPRAC
jgi:cyclopropane-fatty-acyl-phospholipid synthase